jgi:CBS domain-containing protein
MKIRDVMTTDVVTVDSDTSLKEVAATLAERHISGVPVLSGHGRLLGVVSEGDILMKEVGVERRGVLARLLHPHTAHDVAKLEARTAGQAMTSPAITISPDAPLSEAARLMVARQINRLPVVENGQLVGIVTRADVVRTFTREDAEIAREIEEEVLPEYFLMDGHEVGVTVENGIVSLSGKVARRSIAEALPEQLSRMPGVVAVNSFLSWSVDDRG